MGAIAATGGGIAVGSRGTPKRYEMTGDQLTHVGAYCFLTIKKEFHVHRRSLLLRSQRIERGDN